jgi:hypothetical protein
MRKYPNPAVVLQNAPATMCATLVTTEYRNWGDEQQARKCTAVIFDKLPRDTYLVSRSTLRGRTVNVGSVCSLAVAD